MASKEYVVRIMDGREEPVVGQPIYGTLVGSRFYTNLRSAKADARKVAAVILGTVIVTSENGSGEDVVEYVA